ncbi:MAG TPA: ferredoxin [Phycisphaerae bacterium]|nr:ferredoxin [Phycisphaerae bacterium]
MAKKLKIEVNEDECIGDGLCAQEAPNTFEMNDDDKACVKNPPGDDADTILEAAKACPVDAITVTDEETGEQLCPEE